MLNLRKIYSLDVVRLFSSLGDHSVCPLQSEWNFLRLLPHYAHRFRDGLCILLECVSGVVCLFVRKTWQRWTKFSSSALVITHFSLRTPRRCTSGACNRVRPPYQETRAHAAHVYVPHLCDRPGNGRAHINAYIAGSCADGGLDVFVCGLCRTSDNKMTLNSITRLSQPSVDGLSNGLSVQNFRINVLRIVSLLLFIIIKHFFFILNF